MKGAVLWARQYSKRLIAFLMTMWALMAVVGAVYEFIRLKIAPETASMDSFYIYLAAPLTTGIPAYVIPNISLNKEKVKQGYNPHYDAETFGIIDKADMEGEGIGEPFERKEEDEYEL